MLPEATAQTNDQAKWEAKPIKKKDNNINVLLQWKQHLPELKGDELKHLTLYLYFMKIL